MNDTERSTATGLLRKAGVEPKDIPSALTAVEKLSEAGALTTHAAATIAATALVSFGISAPVDLSR